MTVINQYSKLLGTLSKCLEFVEVHTIIDALNGLLDPCAKNTGPHSRKGSKKEMKLRFSSMLLNGTRAVKPGYLKNKKNK